MTLSLTCRSCRQDITGEDEDALVAAVQAHHVSAHGSDHDSGDGPDLGPDHGPAQGAGHGSRHQGRHRSGDGPGTPTRDQVLARLHLRQRREAAGRGPAEGAEPGE
ncbi:hypothetical protein [Streptomyces sp. NPDC020917]|uniref:hypothetical protein n=1 Tax=Streptomyces sp. NPDC020917 TaxID=3365102 RepID=UPI003795C8D0